MTRRELEYWCIGLVQCHGGDAWSAEGYAEMQAAIDPDGVEDWRSAAHYIRVAWRLP